MSANNLLNFLNHEIYFILLTSILSIYDINVSTVKELVLIPEYHSSLSIPLGSCQCSGAFASCAQSCDGSNCTCSCGAFSCTCTACSKLSRREQTSVIKKELDVYPISVSKEQYANLEQLASIIANNERGVETHNSLKLLNEMIVSLKEKNYNNYRLLSSEFELSLS
ncbi:MAG: hypothetical protein WAU01_04550, partial [Saprospiraceae bacterium]